MKTSSELPPNYEAIKAKFGDLPNAIYTYGDTVFNVKEPLNGQMEAHESVHMKQQEKLGKDLWWDYYLNHPSFRTSQEAEAYRAQYDYVKSHTKDGNQRTRFKVAMCRQLADVGELSFNEASKLIYAN